MKQNKLSGKSWKYMSNVIPFRKCVLGPCQTLWCNVRQYAIESSVLVRGMPERKLSQLRSEVILLPR